MQQRKSVIKKYWKYKTSKVKQLFNQSINGFVDVSKMKYEKQKKHYYFWLFIGMIIYAIIIIYQMKKIEVGRVIMIFTAIAFTELAIWAFYLRRVVVLYERCNTKQERKGYTPPKKLVNFTKVLLLPMEIFTFLLKVFGLDVFEEYIVGFIFGLIFSGVSALVITYNFCFKVLVLTGTNEDMYLLAIILVLLFYFIMYITSIIYFYIIRCHDFGYDFERKDRFFKKLWSRIKQMLHIINIVLIYINYVKEGGDGIAKFFLAGFTLVFAIDTLKEKWNK